MTLRIRGCRCTVMISGRDPRFRWAVLAGAGALFAGVLFLAFMAVAAAYLRAWVRTYTR